MTEILTQWTVLTEDYLKANAPISININLKQIKPYISIAEKISKIVLQYDLEGNFIKEWKSTAECGRNGFNQGAVAACCRGKRKTHKGFIWKYK